MSAPDPRSIQARAARALDVWTEAGFDVGALEISPEGAIRILAPGSIPHVPSPKGGDECDEIFGIG